MSGLRFAILVVVVLSALPVRSAERAAADFEIAALEKQAASSRDAVVKAASIINIGDVLDARGQHEAAMQRYVQAKEASEAEALRARKRPDLARYAQALGYAGLAWAKLGERGAAIRAFEEVARYGSDSPTLWNLCASAMNVLGERNRGISASRNALFLSEKGDGERPGDLIDRNVYRYALASALATGGDAAELEEAETLLRVVLTDLEGETFSAIRRDITRREQFEVLSAARGDASAYLTLQNRARLRLGKLLEIQKRPDEAMPVYRQVLQSRPDDAVALSALARLSPPGERLEYFVAAFDANPYSADLARSFEEFVRTGAPLDSSQTSSGGRMRAAIADLALERYAPAKQKFTALNRENPGNELLRALLARAAAGESAPRILPPFLNGAAGEVFEPTLDQLKTTASLISSDSLTPGQRAALDGTTFRSEVQFDSSPASGETTTFASGQILGMPFRLLAPTEFQGRFDASAPLPLEYRIAGAGYEGSALYLIFEPLRIVRP
jgi:tetratricopeptide (TPR) repeat protein